MNAAERLWRGVWYGRPVIVVSGLPRSGTSMMMMMLTAGGVPLLTDAVRSADESNPNGYFEFERVKNLRNDLSWLPAARGKAVKIVSFLLTHLPETLDYRVIFMHRDLEEIIASQNRMLASRGEPIETDGARTRELYSNHLDQVAHFLATRRCFRTLPISYNAAVADARGEAARLAAFLDRDVDIDQMAAVVDSRLYRIRMASRNTP